MEHNMQMSYYQQILVWNNENNHNDNVSQNNYMYIVYLMPGDGSLMYRV